MTPEQVIDAAYSDWLKSDDVKPLSESVFRALLYNGYNVFPVAEIAELHEELAKLKAPSEPDVPFIVVTGSDGSAAWNHESDDVWRQFGGPSFSWSAFIQMARERKWTVTLPGEVL